MRTINEAGREKGGIKLRSLEKELRDYGKKTVVRPDESKICETVFSAKECFYVSIAKRTVRYFDFLYDQMGYIKKRWWLLQFVLLSGAGFFIHAVESAFYEQRLMSVSASLFVILAVPELWKNRSSNSLEIEGAAYFSLRQIYAARMLIFGIVDMAFLGVFACTSILTGTVEASDIVIQFFLPMLVTCCICFRTLCSRYITSEYSACFLAMLWCAVWILLILDDNRYQMISVPVWYGICILAMLYLTYTVNKIIHECQKDWEVCRF